MAKTVAASLDKEHQQFLDLLPGDTPSEKLRNAIFLAVQTRNPTMVREKQVAVRLNDEEWKLLSLLPGSNSAHKLRYCVQRALYGRRKEAEEERKEEITQANLEEKDEKEKKVDIEIFCPACGSRAQVNWFDLKKAKV